MKWASEWQEQWLGDEAPQIIQAAETAFMLGHLNHRTVYRVCTSKGEAAWCRLTMNGDLQCVALAPWDDTWSVDVVDITEFFARRWPATWRTKNNVKAAAKPKPSLPFVQDGFCVSIATQGRAAQLWQVASVSKDGSLQSVRPMLEAPDYAVADRVDQKAWYPLKPEYYEGAAKLLAERPTVAAAYPFIHAKCSNAVIHPMTRAKAKRDAAKKGAKHV